jgi:hypothetical protein
MPYEQKPNTGSLFTNNKRKKENSPHNTGSALIDGVEYWISGWNNVSDKGTPYQSLSFTKKEPKPEQPQQGSSYNRPSQPVVQPGAPAASDYLEDEIPF